VRLFIPLILCGGICSFLLCRQILTFYEFLTKGGHKAKIVSDGLLVKISHKGEIIKESLDCSNVTLAVKIAVSGVKRDTSPAQIITSGPKCTPRSEKAVEYEKAVISELGQL
jgi:hypothetical protein